MPYMRRAVAGFDVGGTKIALALEDETGARLGRVTEPTDTTSSSIEILVAESVYHGLAEQLARMLEDALGAASVDRIAAIAVVSTGPIREGELRSPTNIFPDRLVGNARQLPRRIPLAAPLQRTFDCPVALLNDCAGAVLGEVYRGVGKEVRDKSSLHLVYATISTGFGVAAWDGGHLVAGKHGNAGELGHIPVVADGLPCGCGNRGCAEAYASGGGIRRNAERRLLKLDDETARSLPLARLLVRGTPDAPAVGGVERLTDRLTSEMVFEAAANEDPVAVDVIEEAIFAAGVALSVAANAYDPSIITVGGAIALAHPEIVAPIEREMREHLNVLPPEVCVTPLADAVTEEGALALAHDMLRRGRAEGR